MRAGSSTGNIKLPNRLSTTEEDEEERSPLSPNSSVSVTFEDGMENGGGFPEVDFSVTQKAVARMDGKLFVLSDAAPYGIPVPYPRKTQPRNFRDDRPYSFVRNLFLFRSSAVSGLLPHLLLVVLITALARVLQSVGGLPTLPQSVAIAHGVTGVLLAAVLTARLIKVQLQMREARQLVSALQVDMRDLLMNVTTNDTANPLAERGALLGLSETFRRRINILYAFIRQSVRESREGFCPNSDMADVAFDPHTFALDPTRPRLCDMITEEEFDKYSKLRVSVRPTVVAMELHQLSQALSQLCRAPYLRLVVDGKLHDVMRRWADMLRIADSAAPYALLHLLNLLVFLEVYLSPFIYPATSPSWSVLPIADAGLLSSLLLGVALYGLQAVIVKLAKPFAWEDEHLDLERFGVQLNLDGVEIAKLAGVDQPRLFMTEDMFRDVPKKISTRDYVTYLHRN